MHFFAYPQEMSPVSWNREVPPPSSSASDPELDVISLGRRVRSGQQAGLTLDDVSAAVGTAPSQLSLIENGKREPKLGLLKQLAAALNVGMEQLLDSEFPSRPRGPGNRAGTVPARALV